MDGHPGNFEDQFRRMIINNGSSPTADDLNVRPQHPTVRLPPASSYPVPAKPNAGFLNQAYHGYAQSPPPHFGQGRYGQSPHGRPGSNQFQYNQQPQGPQPTHFTHAQAHQNRGGFYGPTHQRMNNVPPGQRARHQQNVPLDPNAFQRGGYGQPRGRGTQNQLFNPHQARAPHIASFGDQQQRKITYLQELVSSEVGGIQMTQAERDEKEAFRRALQEACKEVCDADPGRLPRVSLESFGSFKTGFATAGSDMDLVIVVKDQSSTSASLSLLEDDLPRALERKLLELDYGARLLTRTRVPIIKVCEKPDSSLLSKLRAEREKWDFLPNDLKYPHLHQKGEDEAEEGAVNGTTPAAQAAAEAASVTAQVEEPKLSAEPISSQKSDQKRHADITSGKSRTDSAQDQSVPEQQATQDEEAKRTDKPRPKRDERPWIRERKAGPLDFPKSGVGIQSDINFFNPLGLHNTQLLYCYSLCDDRVQPMVLFVKEWAKRRKINSSYSGTLSSYGYVLMVLHYLVNVASPPVLPNLQACGPQPGSKSPPDEGIEVDGWNVRFWRNDEEIVAQKQQGRINVNREPIGSLLAGFFQYYSSQGGHPQFVWTQQTLSLRSQGGILTKDEKGWTKAVTEEGEGKKIQHRYLFCVEDPFELSHNVARTVTHNGIVAIRDEFRRARRILLAVGRGEMPHEGHLFDQLIEPEPEPYSISHEPAGAGWQPDLDGVSDKLSTKAQSERQKPANNNNNNNNNGRGSKGNKKSPQTPSTPKSPNSLNVKDNDAFPSLGSSSGTKSSKRRSPHKRSPSTGEWSEISGDKAKAVLDEVKRKKDEAQAESTAMGAAEAVLVGDDDW